MAEAMILRRGGSGRTLSGYAVLCAQFPAGSECRCERSGTVLKAREKTGAAAFLVPCAGTWTLSCTDGTRTRSKSVSVTGAGQAALVNLGYSLALLSPEQGLAAGYHLTGSASMSGHSIRESGEGGFCLLPAVNLTEYSTLTISGLVRHAQYGDSRLCVGSTTDKVLSLTQTPERWTSMSGLLPDTPQTVTLDVSGLAGSYYIGSTQLGNNLEITAITLT